MNITAGEAPLIVVGLILYALLWFAVGRRTSPHRRRKRDARPITPVGERPQNVTGDLAAARMTPAEAMANAAPADAPPEMERLEATAQIPQYDTIAIEATTKPPEPLELPAIAPSSLAAWEPPEPRLVLTVAWDPPAADRPPVWDRFDITDPVAMRNNQTAEDGELGVQSLWQILDNQRREHGGTVRVTVTAAGRLVHQWKNADWDVWTNEAVPVIRDARIRMERAHA